ncbi:MAG: hypothetical protein D6790_21795 [Caldilineae bacterium]|nr:MAG: hypothetical protein D6790_21795 [Caldilineae bacterium]
MRLFEVCSALNLSAETVVLGAIDTGLPLSDQLLDCDIDAKLSDELLRATARELLGESEGEKFFSEVKQKTVEAKSKRQERREAKRRQANAQAFKAPNTNTDAIARIRGVDFTSAAEFWNQVNAAAKRRLSTYEVLMLLRAQGEKASTISPQELASTLQPLPAAPKPASKPTTPRPLPSTQAPRTDHSNKPATASPLEPVSSDLQATLAQRYGLSPVEAEELHDLLAFMAPKRFETSKQLSNFIVTHQLGHRYPNISGIVRMELDGEEWDFKGGFPPKIYAIICDELGLSNQGTRARPIGFIPFRDLYEG